MPVLNVLETRTYLRFDAAQCAAVGESLATEYRSATPFPHIVMDDFLDGKLLSSLAAEFPGRDGLTHFDRDQERLKYQFHPDVIGSGRIRNLLAELNGSAFLGFLEKMTGIEGLIPDPYFVGAGLHETLSGGHLGIHADFNLHDKLKLERRLNLLIYLNDDWQSAYGGALELWDRKMRAAARTVLPALGTAVVFTTDKHSFHGQPDPLACPKDRSRRSIATYYYTALDSGLSPGRYTTLFQARPQSGDRRDVGVAVHNFLNNWMPPRLQGPARRLASKVVNAASARR